MLRVFRNDYLNHIAICLLSCWLWWRERRNGSENEASGNKGGVNVNENEVRDKPWLNSKPSLKVLESKDIANSRRSELKALIASHKD